ncbi:hypothetical protein BDV28DRAFT_131346 [Aspergillus coremiiformis]|uniref:Uncharacterized protein n=1 Tax=Aspergillus coremiiformis TaxID=138285 RepID=A0A5N6Z9Z1_9EURO|nr:hypothetical protein BDV28DRAFT_131346 [Aspergillus coremiiformis]
MMNGDSLLPMWSSYLPSAFLISFIFLVLISCSSFCVLPFPVAGLVFSQCSTASQGFRLTCCNHRTLYIYCLLVKTIE